MLVASNKYITTSTTLHIKFSGYNVNLVNAFIFVFNTKKKIHKTTNKIQLPAFKVNNLKTSLYIWKICVHKLLV